MQELTSVVFAPLILYFSLPKRAFEIVDFFRDFSVRVPGSGHVCSFAVFDFVKHGNKRYGAIGHPGNIAEEMMTREGKMEHSFMSFKVISG